MLTSLLLSLALTTSVAGGGGELLLKSGDRAPPFSMRDLDRKVFSLFDHTGKDAKDPKKAIVMAFFATWCGPCKKEIPIIKEVYAEWKDHGVTVVYLGLAQGAKELGPWAKEAKLPWQVVPDTFGILSRRYGASKLPHLLIIDKDGKVSFQHQGIAANLKQVIDGELSKLTGRAVTKAAPAPAAEERFKTTVRFGRVPASDGAAEKWAPLASFLREQAEAEFEMGSAKSYAAFEKALKKGDFDLVNAGPLMCFKYRDQYEPVVRVERQGSPSYNGIVFSLRSRKFNDIKDLKGKTIGLVSKESTSGGLYAQKALLDAGLIPGKNIKIKWLGSHDEVARAVKAKRVDAGACIADCRDSVWKSAADKGNKTKVLGYTVEIPAEMVIVRRALDPALKARLVKAMLAAGDQEGIMQQISASELPITGLTAATDKDLTPVASAVEQVAKKQRAK